MEARIVNKAQAALLAALSITALSFCSQAQTPLPNVSSGCSSSHRLVTPKNPRTGPDGYFLTGQSIVQGRYLFDSGKRSGLWHRVAEHRNIWGSPESNGYPVRSIEVRSRRQNNNSSCRASERQQRLRQLQLDDHRSAWARTKGLCSQAADQIWIAFSHRRSRLVLYIS